MPQFVEYFMVCGLDAKSLEKESASSSAHVPPLCRSYTPSILTHLPDSRDSCPFDQGAFQTLCLPDGVQLQKNVKQVHRSFHPFLLTRENGSHAYGSVLVYQEQITDSKLLISLEAMQTAYTAARRTSFNSDHEDYFDRQEDELFALKCLCLVVSQPIHQPCRAYLEQLHAVTVGELTTPLSIESYLFNLLYEVSLPEPGKYLKLSGPLGKISWYLPPKSDLPLCDYSFREFFEILGVRDILRVLTCVLMEHQLLIKSTDYHRLMLGANCLAALLFPFSWPHVFVPILPASQRGFLDAPVPYIMGLRVLPSTNLSKFLTIANESSLCSVDLDRRVVETLDDLPALPKSDTLLSQLSEKIQEHSVNCPDLRDLPVSPKTAPSMARVVEAIRIVNELRKSPAGTDQQKVISEISGQAKDNPLLPNLLNIAKRAGITGLEEGVLTELGNWVGGSDDEEEDGHSEKNMWDFCPDKKDQRFSAAVREVFAAYFVEHFANYENFIIIPSQTYEQWVRNREQFQNFDKTAFLSDQPTQYWPFYSAFLESSMFSAFIDEKVTSMWLPEKASQQLLLFDSRVEAYRDKSGLAKPPTTPGCRNPGSMGTFLQPEAEEPEEALSSDNVIAESAPLPHQLLGESQSVLVAMRTKTRRTGAFPELDLLLLQARPSPNKSGDDSRILSHSLPHPSLSMPRPSSAGRLRHTNISLSPSPTIFSRRMRGRVRGGGNPVGGASVGFSSHSHAKFVNQLMRESRFRVKHMMGSSPDSHSSVEENTHIACLCDLLERIWGHGLKKRDSKSPLWAHLTAYAETAEAEEGGAGFPPSHPPSPPLLSSSMSSLSMMSTSTTTSSSSSSSSSSTTEEAPSRTARGISAHFRRRKFGSPQLRSQIEGILQPPPSSLLTDFLIVRNMRELKTDVGHARAWVRLALEKKSLSRHLSALLAKEELTSQRYKGYAFLRTEEEREQFLYHLLTLTAKDFSCFTNGFLNSTMVYRVLVVGEGKRFGLSSSSLYVTMAGENGDSGVAEIPRGESQTEITHHNLGPLTCLRVGHDNSGITPSLLVEMVLVRNSTTGQIYRFNCGQWLSRSEEDGSIERFLVAKKVPQTIKNSVNMAALGVDGVLPSPGSKRRGSKRDIEITGEVSQLKTNLRLAIEKTKMAAQSKGSQNTVQELLQLIHGENGYIQCMERVLLFGFKSSRKFGKRLLLWDLVERVCEHIRVSAVPTPLVSTAPQPGSSERQLFCQTVDRINSNYTQIGKNEKMVLFLCVGLRDHYIATWVSVIVQCSPVLAVLYEPLSFLREPELLHFLTYTLTSSSSLLLRLEPLLTQGM